MMRPFDRRTILRAAAAGLPLALLPATGWTDQPGQNGAPGAQTSATQAPDVGDIFIGELEKRIISDYYSRHLYAFEQSSEGRDYKKHKNKHKGGLPPGLAKKGTLPPGLAKQLARNGHLPPGLDYQPLPRDLMVQLPPLQQGYRYTIVDNKVMLVQAASNLILDALEVAALAVLN